LSANRPKSSLGWVGTLRTYVLSQPFVLQWLRVAKVPDLGRLYVT